MATGTVGGGWWMREDERRKERQRERLPLGSGHWGRGKKMSLDESFLHWVILGHWISVTSLTVKATLHACIGCVYEHCKCKNILT